jgi:hypothetical protein
VHQGQDIQAGNVATLDNRKGIMRRFGLVFILQILFILTLLFSCSSDKQKEVQPQSPPSTPSSKLEIQPFEATRDTTFYISSTGLNLSKAKIEWLVNGVPVEEKSDSQFRSPDIKKGDNVQARVLIDNQEILSNQITINNIPPTITKAKILPAVSKAGDILKVDAIGSDRDGDEVSLSFAWSKNGEPAGSNETLEAPFKRGDKISVRITPFDGEAYGQPITLTTEIYNSPPRASTGGTEKLENNIYSYQIKATDPDGDVLTYTLKQAPKNMTIDKTGLITWKVREEDAGIHPVTVQITDGHGGEILYNFNVTIRFQ